MMESKASQTDTHNTRLSLTEHPKAAVDVVATETLPQIIVSLEKKTMAGGRTVRPGLCLATALEPSLQEMQVALASLGATLPEKFDGLRNWVEANRAMTQELGGEVELSSAVVGWCRRLQWLREEYHAMCCYERGSADTSREQEQAKVLLEWRELFIEKAVNGVPKAWLERLRVPKTPIADFEILAPVRLLGAELFMLCDRIAAAGQAASPQQVDFDRFVNHVSLHRLGLVDLEKAGTTTFDLTGAIKDLSDLERAAQRWATSQLSYGDFREEGWQIYQRLSARTTLAHVPKARELKLSLLEVNTEYSGSCSQLIPLLSEIDKNLLIDPTLNVPQNGHGSICPPAIMRAVLQSYGCRVFLIQFGMETKGYLLFAPNPPPELLPTPTFFQDLAEKGHIRDPHDERPGLFAIASIEKAAREVLHQVGIRGYPLFDPAMTQAAIYEGRQTLVLTVRTGPNRNPAKRSYLKAGWHETGFIVTRGTPGAPPLEVLVRDNTTGTQVPPGSIPPPPDNWGLNPHYRTYTSADPRSERFTSAAPISDYDAVQRCREFIATSGKAIEVAAYHGSLGFYIALSDGIGSAYLHQQRPRFDLWRCDVAHPSATLSEQLSVIGGLADFCV
jgi:hypothetical protein